MKDRLPCAGTDVENCAISVFDVALTRDLGRDEMASADDFGVGCLGFFQSREMFFGNDQYVCWRLRIDVFKGENMVVFMDFLCGNFSANDAAKEAVGGCVDHS